MLKVVSSSLDAVIRDAVTCYPYECCGFLLGRRQAEETVVDKVLVCRNVSDRKETTFLISADEYKAAEQLADESGLTLLGVYHSHPDSAPVPSETDRIAALPNFFYLIVSVYEYAVASAKGWQLEDGAFSEEEIRLVSEPQSKRKSNYGNYHYTYTAS